MSDTLYVPQTTVLTAANFIQPVNDALYKGVDPKYATTTGTANAQVFTLPAGSLVAALVAGMRFSMKAGFTNTGAMTLQVVGASALTAVAVQAGGSALTGGEFASGNTMEIIYDGAAFQILANRMAPAEIASGALDGSNVTFTLTHAPMVGKLQLFQNRGALTTLAPMSDYSITGNTITMAVAPASTDVLFTGPYPY
jgi:hypothetical protein